MTPRPRGRPRSFDPDIALDRALEVFWSRGFAASSLDELCAAMGIARPSLYAAFGDKQDLYLAIVQRFRDTLAADYRAAMLSADTYRGGILAYLRAAIARYTSGDAARGCLAVCTATAEAAVHPRIREALAAVLAELDAAFEATLQRAVARGELPASADIATLAALLSATQHSLAVRARAGASTAELRQRAAGAVATVFGVGSPPRPARAVRRAPASRATTLPDPKRATRRA
jgi:TetR/AcrR family transcriptional regulator, copper-responsive repressor